jgi:mono/diheme cytochrome c family protein
MIRGAMPVVLIFLLGHLAPAAAQPAIDAQRGRLLYETHCIACHTERMHWREKKLVKDWESLRVQVRRWQEVAALRWSEADIESVSRYLNTAYYHNTAPD